MFSASFVSSARIYPLRMPVFNVYYLDFIECTLENFCTILQGYQGFWKLIGWAPYVRYIYYINSYHILYVLQMHPKSAPCPHVFLLPLPPKKKKCRPCVCKNKKAWHLAPPIALHPFKNQLLFTE